MNNLFSHELTVTFPVFPVVVFSVLFFFFFFFILRIFRMSAKRRLHPPKTHITRGRVLKKELVLSEGADGGLFVAIETAAGERVFLIFNRFLLCENPQLRWTTMIAIEGLISIGDTISVETDNEDAGIRNVLKFLSVKKTPAPQVAA